jgi:poly(hydroxyalkanoate) synthase III subunit E
MADNATTNPLFDMWRRQFEESVTAWSRLAGQVPQPAAPDPTAFWRPVLNQGLEQWARLFAQTPVSPDLAAQWKQFLDDWIEAWSKALGQVMNTNAYAEMMGKYLDQQLVAQGPFKKATEQTLESALQAFSLPSRGQVTAVAKQIVELEERIEGLEDGIAEILKRLDGKEPR